ncbi:tonsoku-like protein [Panulirus ornatus]|uniref:tonsoku-like protein n=1 Tax=Panulirus ornatus TaxID=150431 RepID=UPI003A8C8171
MKHGTYWTVNEGSLLKAREVSKMSEVARLEREKCRAENKNNLREVANLSNLLGRKLQEAGDFEGALAQHQEESALCEALGDTIGVAVSHRRMGEVYSEMGQWKKALQHQHRHLSLAKEADSLVEEQRAYATIGRTHLQRAEECSYNGLDEEKALALTEAEKAFLRSLSTCEHLKGAVDTQEHSQMRCRLYLNLGLVLDNRGKAKKARDFIGQALEQCYSYSLHEDAQRCHSALGVILLREGLLAQALQEGQKSLALSARLHDKALQCDGHSFLAQIHLLNADYEASKKCFYKAYKLKHPDLEDRRRIEKNLKTVVSLCTTAEALVTEEGDDEKLKLYEKLGDGLADLSLYSLATGYYHKMLEVAIRLDKCPSILAPIYLSLARTYSDNKQFKEAKEYYLKEYNIKVKEDPSEACKTLISIADTSEELQETYETLSTIYQQARELSVKANNPKLEVYVLRLYSLLKEIPPSVKMELEGEINRLIEENDLDPEVELSEEEENDNESEVDLDEIYFSDSDNDQENFDRPQQSRQRKTFVVKRNEKGESPLHKACIDGNLNMVKKLLQQGHPVNPRDNCGWLPLHEAANHGFYDIVLTLIESGAWINDRGGQHCDGITPIHDAASCGNLEVVRLLMNRGASIISKTNEGDTPLESLVKYRKRTKLSQTEEEEYIALERELKEKMDRAGHRIPELLYENSAVGKTETKIPSKLHGRKSDGKILSLYSTSNDDEIESYSRSTSPKSKVGHSYSQRRSDEGKVETLFKWKRKLSSRSTLDTGEESEEEDVLSNTSPTPSNTEKPLYSPSRDDISDNEDSEEFLNPLLEDIHHEKKSATGAYLNAIGSVGSAARRAQLKKNSPSSLVFKREKKMALLSEEDNVGDDWLDDDLGIFTKKRKRMEKSEFEYKEQRKEQKALTENYVKKTPLCRPKKAHQMKLTSIVQRYSDNISRVGTSDNFEDENVIAENSSGSLMESNVAVDMCEVNESKTSVSVSGTVAVGGALRLRVRVENRVLLVPVAGAGQGRTVGWLAEEVTRRYYQLVGLRPHLTLTTQDGAVLDISDPISLVLPTEQAELQAQVTGWDLPPLPDRYAQACQALGCIPAPSLNSILHRTEASTTLDLSCVGRLMTSHVQPVLRALQCQQSLRCLILANCRLGDDGFHYLMEALPSLPSLDVLNLKASAITTSSFLEFTEAITSAKLSLKTLNSLDLSYNTFSGAKVTNVGALFKLPVLTVLSLKHCNLFLTGEQQLPVFTSALKTLSLDYNSIYSVALATLLSCVPKISTLTLSGLNCKRDTASEISPRLGIALSGILGAGEECLLEHLDLSSCCLMDADLEDISAYLYRCPRLISVNLAHNPSLTVSSVSVLFNELTTNIILPLTDLSLHGNKSLTHDLEDRLASTLQHKSATKHAITKLSLTAVGKVTQIEDIWRTQYQQKAAITRIGNELFLSCRKK